MITTLRDNIVYRSFSDQSELSKEILSMICDEKTDKILYKGLPDNINYKLLKKVLTKEKDIAPDTVRSMFGEVIKKTNDEYCLIFKQ
jgi:hypothetical protein